MSFLLLLGKKGPTFTLYDAFSTDAVAPLASPRTCEPIGTLTVVDTENKLSISGGKLVCAGGKATPAWGDPVFRGSATVRAAGIALLGSATPSATDKYGWVGFSDGTSPGAISAAVPAIGFWPSAALHAGPGDYNVGNVYVAGTAYDVAVVLRATGNFILIRGGAFTKWTLLAVANTSTVSPLYPAMSTYSLPLSLDNFRVTNLGAYDSRFASDYGLANSRLVSPAITTAFTHQADCLLETTFTWTTATAFGLTFRQTDANNFWKVLADTDGSLKLIVTVAGTPTTVANVAATFTNGQAYRVVVVTEGSKYIVYVNNVQKAAYTDADNNFLTSTGGTAATAGLSEVIAWPRFVILPAELG